MKRMRTRMKRVWSIVLTVAMLISMCSMPVVTAKADAPAARSCNHVCNEACGGLGAVSGGAATVCTHVHDEECGYEEAEAECTCETDDPAFHATNCPAYIAPENPQCTCAEKCTDDTLNVWCDVCGMQGVSACQGEDTAVTYDAATPDFSAAKVLTAVDGVLCIDGEAITDRIMPAGDYKLESDITTDIFVYTEGSINIDLNGHTWNMSDKNLRIDDDVTLSLYDTSGEGTGKITSSYMQTVYGVGSGTTFNLYSGTVENTSNEGNDKVVFSSYGIINLYGGTIKSNAYAVLYYLHRDITINIDNTSFDCGDGHAQISASFSPYEEPCAVIDVSDYAGGALTVDAEINKAAVIKFFTGIRSAEDADNYKINFSCDDNKDFFKEKEEYEEDGGNKYVYVSVPSFTTQPTEENDYTVAFNHPDATLQWCEVTVYDSATYSEEDGDHYKSYEVNAGDTLIVSLSECLDDFGVTFDCSYNEESLYIMSLDSSRKTASVTFDFEGTVDVYFMPSPYGTGEYKMEHVRCTELEGENGVQLSKTECETTYVCKATVGEREYCSDEVTIEQEHSYTCTATSDNVITKECANCGKSGTLTITAEGGVYDGTTAYGATVKKTGILENEEVIVNYYQDDTLIGTNAPVDEGTYTAKITYEGVTVYDEFEITEATPTAEMFTYIESAVYDGTEKSANVVVKDGITGIGAITNIKYYQNGEATTPVNAGEYTVKIDVAEGDFFDAATDIEVGTFTITKATYSVDTINKNYLYARSNADSINLAELLPEDCGTINYASVTSNGPLRFISEPKVTNGILAYTLESGAADDTGIIVVDVETLNYEDITITVNVTLIDQIPVNVDGEVELNRNVLTYGETLSGLTFKSVDFVDDAGNEVAGTLAWKEPSATPNAGTTSATWVFTPNNAAYASVEGTVAITVNKATPNVTEVSTVADRVYNPSVILADSDLTGGTVKGVDGNGLAGGWSWQSTNVVPVVNNSGYIAVFTPTDSTNYESVTKTINVTVTKATPVAAVRPSATAITYGDTLGTSVLSGGSAQYSGSDTTEVTGSFAWKDASAKPAVADSGVTGYTVVFTPEDSANYNSVEVLVSLTVNKAATAPNMPSATMNVAYGVKTVGAVTLPEGWAWEAADAAKALIAGEAVTATAVYTGADAGNYATETVEVMITRSTCSHSGGTATCKDKAVCETCGEFYGDVDYTNHANTATALTYDKTGHWDECEGCGEDLNKADHSCTSEVTKQPTTEEEGERTYRCDCGYSYTEAVEKLEPTPTPGGGSSGGSTGGGSSGGSAGGGSYYPPYVPSNPTPTAAPTAAPTAVPEPEKIPHIQGADGKAGWDAICDVIEDVIEDAKDSKENAVVTVDMNGTTKVPKDVFEQIAGKDISVEFVLGDGLMWNVNGKDADTKGLKDIDLAVTLESKENPLTSIPATIINAIAGERKSVKMQLAHSGEFGFEAVLTVGLEEKNAGMYANLFFFNPVTKALEFICADVIAANGKAELSFTHASDYLVVLSEESMEPVQEEPLAPEDDKDEEAAEEPEKEPVTEITYTVVKGDTLSKIAAKYGCTVREMVALNKELIQNQDVIQIGWKLRIPVKGAEPAPEQETPAVPVEDKKYVVYVVKKGDTLRAISQIYGCTVKELMELNREQIKEADMISIGWELKVPEK